MKPPIEPNGLRCFGLLVRFVNLRETSAALRPETWEGIIVLNNVITFDSEGITADFVK